MTQVVKLYDPNHIYYKHYTKKNLANYHGQKSMATKRNVEWGFTFDTWIKWWVDTGHFENRGVRNDNHQMCRVGDRGPYHPDNVYCDLASNNKRTFIENNPEWVEKKRIHGKTINPYRWLNREKPKKKGKTKKITAIDVNTQETVTFNTIKELSDQGYSRYMIDKSIELQREYKGYIFTKKYKQT